MDAHTLECYIKAGKIASDVREKSKNWVVPGAKLLDVAEKIEAGIKSMGGLPAFPVNISINEIAAHYTPFDTDTKAFQKEDVVKIDIGVHVDGYIADTATTIYLGEDTRKRALAVASESALEAALALATPGRKISELSSAIDKKIRELGFVPISNLSGHYLGRYVIHAAPSIPNIYTGSSAVLKEGDVIAIEPFATTGSGEVKETGRAMIFGYGNGKQTRLPASRQILMFAGDMNGLPFASRWITGLQGLMKDRALSELVSVGALHAYPVLKEVAGGLVSQAEHTVIVGAKPRITTL